MNSSLWFADRFTHIKIVVVALVATIVIVGVEISARTDEWNATAVMAKVNGPVLKAGRPANTAISDVSKIR